MSGGSRTEDRGWAAVLLLVVAAAFLLARTIPGGGGEAGGPPVDADLPTYGADEAGSHVGEVARVCGAVASASWAREVDGQPTFLNLGRPYPDQPFTVVIWGEHRARFDAPERRWLGRRICAAGRIREHEGTPQVVATRPAQIGPQAALADSVRPR